MKKIIWIIIILILAGALGLGAYWVFDRQENGGPSRGNISIGDFFPFGQGGEPVPFEPVVVDPNPIPTNPAVLPRLWKISQNPQSGAGFLIRDGDNFIRFIDTATGNIFENRVSDFTLSRISNTTIPKIKEVTWLTSGNDAILRYMNDAGVIQTMYAKISPPKPTANAGTTETVNATSSAVASEIEVRELQELQATFLPGNINALALFGAKGRIFYVVENGGGNGVGYTALADGTRPAKIFESPINEWSVSWPRENTIVITTKPSALALGYSYMLNSTSGALERLLGGVAGLSVNPAPNLVKVIYSESTATGPTLKLFDVKTGARTVITKTFAEKCLWQKDNIRIICAVPKNFPSGTFPDNWYDGQITLTDSISQINTETGQSVVIADLRELAGTEIDVINLMIDTAENNLLFTNKKDSSLWKFQINEQ